MTEVREGSMRTTLDISLIKDIYIYIYIRIYYTYKEFECEIVLVAFGGL